MTVAAAGLLLTVLVAAGHGALALCSSRPSDRAGRECHWVLALAAGLLVLELCFLAAHFTGIRWSPWTALPPLALLGALPALTRRGRPGLVSPRCLPGFGPGDVLTLTALALFAGLTATGWLIFPDLVYHWGIKAGKFALHGGLDLGLLTAPADFVLHPDYPILLPALVATTAQIAGTPETSGVAAGMVWGPILALAVWLAGRRWLAERIGSRLTFQAATAAFGLYLAFHAVAYRRSTDADWFLALALLLAAPVLERTAHSGPLDVRGALRIGIAAALAAGAKIEGMPLALFLLAAGALRMSALPTSIGASAAAQTPGDPGATGWSRWLALLTPTTLVCAPWMLIIVRNDLFAGTNWGGLHLGRFPTISGAMLEAAGHSLWAGFGLLTLLLMPLLWLVPRQRLVAAVLTLQLGFYVFAYLTTPVGSLHLVETTFARLLGHLTPVALVASMVAADRWSR